MATNEVHLVGFHHVQLAMPTGEEARAEAFYSGVLGLENVEKPDSLRGRGGCWFRGPGVEVHLGVEEPFRPARKAHPAFLVAGLDALRARIEGAGMEVDEQPPLPGYRRFHTFDPFGNRLEVLERAAET
jgi:catechol 2,3-dioxygenase-like lactoylglutathione lyase family enzyme